MIVLSCVLGEYALAVPPADHTSSEHGYMHADDKDLPYSSHCTDCHAPDLGGGLGPSCYQCHVEYWNPYDYVNGAPPLDHTIIKNGFADHKPGYETPFISGCTDCHGPNLNDGFAPSCQDCHSNADHTVNRNGFYHKPGTGDPYADGCTQCHGPTLEGGIGPSCQNCHSNADHTVNRNGVNHKPGTSDPYADGCTQCHGPTLTGGLGPSCFTCHDGSDHTVDRNGANHKPGTSDPYADGCQNCHGPTLEGGFGPSCQDCHSNADHTVNRGGANHKPGTSDPYADGCTLCHGPTLEGGLGPSCFTCHGATWSNHDFSGSPWLVGNQCYVCHLPPAFGPGATSDPVWNHAEGPTSGYTVTSTLIGDPPGQPNGVSLKCLDCHEGSVPVNNYGGQQHGTAEYITGSAAFGVNLDSHHPVSFVFDLNRVLVHGALNDPATAPSNLSPNGTIAEDLLDDTGQLQCTSCHDQHNDTNDDYLINTDVTLCFTCHDFEANQPDDFVAPQTNKHHIPDREHPWGNFRCTLCHGTNLDGTPAEGGDGMAPACTSCHNPFLSPEAPPTGHHGGDRFLPYFDCDVCHADPLTGILTGNNFGTGWAPSCYQCHDDLWNDPGNLPPTVDAGGPYTGTVGRAITFDASGSSDPEGKPLAYSWLFGDGSPAEIPTHNPILTHTYDDYGTYQAALVVTDGVNDPIVVPFTVTIGDYMAPAPADAWEVTTTEPEVFTVTFENHTGSLVGVKDDGSLSFGVEFVGVIFWMDIWMDLSGNAFWGTGDIYFGNIDRAAGTMSGVVFDQEGGVHTFIGSESP